MVARLLWEQEAASSSLATPILQTHVDSMRISVRFCFACETAGKNPNVRKNCAHCKTVFQKQSSLFSISSPFAGLIKAHKCGILNSTLFERSKEVRPMAIGVPRPLAIEKPQAVDLVQAARYFGAHGEPDAATLALLQKCAVPLLAVAMPRAVWLLSLIHI